MHGPAARLGRSRKRLAIHDGVGDVRRTTIGDPLLGRRWKLGAHAESDARYRDGHRRRQHLEALACAARRGLADPLDERHGIGQRDRPRPRAREVAAHRPRPFVVIRVRGETVGEVDATTVEQLTPGRDRDEDGGVTVLRDPDGRLILHSRFRHRVVPRRHAWEHDFARRITLAVRGCTSGSRGFDPGPRWRRHRMGLGSSHMHLRPFLALSVLVASLALARAARAGKAC